MDTNETAYIAAYRNVILAVSDCTAYVTPALSQQVETLEALIPADRIEILRDSARR